jgi:apolipoprotein N-acyltransferase
MNQVFLKKISCYYLSGNGWWMPLIAGLLYSLALPPFNHETHWSLFLFPLFSFIILLPLFAFAVQPSFKRAVLHMYLYGFTAAFGQYHWLLFDNVEGLWHFVIMGLLLTSAIVGLMYLAAGLLFRTATRSLPKAYLLVFPAIWVAIDYGRTLGDLAFPWAFLGYTLTPVLPTAQLASITGVWGLTFAIVLGNVLVWELLKSSYRDTGLTKQWRALACFAATVVVISAGGWYRMFHYAKNDHTTIKISLLQSNIDQFHWNNNSLDTAFAISDSLITAAAEQKPDLMLLPESSLLCFITHRSAYRDRLSRMVRRSRTPLIFGSLDWVRAPSGSAYDSYVYNTAFCVDTGTLRFTPYHKIQLVPFSESIPFEGLFPLLSRVNLGEADFQRGKEQTVFTIGADLKAAPFICYESIFPDFVRKRVCRGANLMVQITNDGWFGRSSGPYHHAMMARMRSIENGVALARCANSGISMFVDPLGKMHGHTGLYERTILTESIPRYVIPTFYLRFGDWFVALCVVIIAWGTIQGIINRHRAKQYK